MIFAMFLLLSMIGMFLLGIDIFMPIPMPFLLVFTFRILGAALIGIGVCILSIRIVQTGVHLFINPVKPRRVILLHQRRGKNPNAFFLPGRLEELEHISARNKLFKDTGGGFRIAGHDVRRTHETICHDIPEWLGQYFYQVSKKYGVEDIEELETIYNAIKNMKSLETLKAIIDPDIVNDEEKWKEIEKMDINDVRNLSELLYTGQIIHMEDAENFISSATPNELDTYVNQKWSHKLMQTKTYGAPGYVDWAKWIPILVVLFIGAAIAFQIIAGGR